MDTRRRNILLAATGLAAGGAGAIVISARSRPGFVFEPLPGEPGFRRLDAGSVSGAFDPLAGIGTGRLPAAPAADLCQLLFGPAPFAAGPMPVASFSDYQCPHCRALTQALLTLEADRRIRVTWHELPLLGEASMVAARAALAADAQEAYAAFHTRLMRARFAPNAAYVAEIAESIGLDQERLRRDMMSDSVTARLATSFSLARRLRLRGTPALVVGRTIVVGAIQVARLALLIELESLEKAPPCPR